MIEPTSLIRLEYLRTNWILFRHPLRSQKRIWPALLLTLLVAAVWHWGAVSDRVSAQGGQGDLGVVVSDERLSVTEGSTGSYTFRLSAAPQARVVVQPEVAGSPSGRVVTVAPSALVFTPADWRRSQRVHVSVTQNDVDEPDAVDAATVEHRLFPDDGGTGPYSPVSISIIDDDAVGVSLSRSSLSVSEGDDATYLVSLTSQPGSDITVDPQSDDPEAATVRPRSLTFTAEDWHVPQAVVVGGVRDFVDDGRNRPVLITHDVSGVGSGYAGFVADAVSVAVRDDDVKGVWLSPSGLVLVEGDTGAYKVALGSKPVSAVTVRVASSATGVATVSPSELTFDASNWNVKQEVTVSGVADTVFTGVRSASIRHTFSGGGYGGLRAGAFVVQVADDEAPAGSPLLFSGRSLRVAEEAEGLYRVGLADRPSGSVRVTLSSSDDAVAKVSPSVLTFAAGDWDEDQAVRVIGVADAALVRQDRFAQISHRVSGGGLSAGNAGYVSVRVPDDDPSPGDPGVVFSQDEGGFLSVDEGGNGYYQVSLDSRPSGAVTVTVSTSHPVAVTAAPAFLVFGPSNWGAPQTVTVHAVENYVDEPGGGRAVLTHRASGGGYDAVPARRLDVHVTDDDSPGVRLSSSRLRLSESGRVAYSVALESKPTGDVTVYVDELVSSAVSPAVSVGSSQLVFTPLNWRIPQVVRVSAFDDSLVNGTREVTIRHAVSGGGYGGGVVAPQSVVVQVSDDDRSGVVISSSTISLEPLAATTYAVRLDSRPESGVTVTVTPTFFDGVVTLSPPSLQFTSNDWSVDQLVTVTAGAEAGDFTISHMVDGEDVGYVLVTVFASLGFDVSITPAALAMDVGGGGSYTVKLELDEDPSGPVTVAVSGSDHAVATVSESLLTFGVDDWRVPQRVTVRGVSAGTVRISHVANGGPFENVAVGVVSVTVSASSPVVQVSTGRLDLVKGTSTRYTISLGDEPVEDVLVDLRGFNVGTAVVSPSSVTLDTDNWRFGVEVTVTAVAAGKTAVSHFLPDDSSGPVVVVRVFSDVALGGFMIEGTRNDGGELLWDYIGDEITVRGNGLSGGDRAWVYRVVPDGSGEPLSCDTDFAAAVRLADDDVATDGTFSVSVPVSGGLFEVGENYACLVDADGRGSLNKPLVFRAEDPPDTYRVWLKDVIVTQPEATDRLSGDVLPDDFRVHQGKQYGDTDPWVLPQKRQGTVAGSLKVHLESAGTLHRCHNTTVPEIVTGTGGRVGCEWAPHDDLPADEPWRVGYEPADPDHLEALLVPGDELTFRVDFSGSDVNVVQDRFAIFWGPVDLWRLQAGADMADFAIHSEHTVGLHHQYVQQADLTDDRFYEFTIPRFGSTNFEGDTFVALVSCNPDYLSGFTGAEVDNHERGLPDCSRTIVPGVDFSAVGGTSVGADDGFEPLRLAWGQHDVLSGNGLTCDVVVAVARVPVDPEDVSAGYSYARAYDVDCHNDDADSGVFTRSAADDCDTELRAAATSVPADSAFTDDVALIDHDGLKCGWGPPVPFLHDGSFLDGRSDAGPWASTKYNTARSFYGFVVDWERGFGGLSSEGGFDPYLLSYRLAMCEGDLGRVPYGAQRDGVPRGTARWNLAGGEITVPDGVDSVSVPLRTPLTYCGWSGTDQSWYDGLPMHFALYVSGMPAEHDYRAEGSEETDWRRVWLGSWDWGDDLDVDDGDGAKRRPLGLAFPVGAGGDASPGGAYLPPGVDSMQGGWSFEVTRDYADKNGRVHLFVVPCLPWYSSATDPDLSRCVDLAEQAGSDSVVGFVKSTSVGPFGVGNVDSTETPSSIPVRYSRRVVVSFGNVAPGVANERPVSVPRRAVVSGDEACAVVRGDYWQEALTWQGGCDSDTLAPVDVFFHNVGDGARDQNFVVYATGGRSDGLDLALTRRSAPLGSPSVQLGRLGLLERRPLYVMAGSTDSKVVVTPDMSGSDGEVWLFAYECGGAATPICSRVTRPLDGGVASFDVAQSPAFAVRVKYTDASGLRRSDVGLVCQGNDCDPLTPVLRAAFPDDAGACSVNVLDGGVDDLTYWPDRVVSGGACSPESYEPVTVSVNNNTGYARRVVVYSTGGHAAGLGLAQVRRDLPVGSRGLSGLAGLGRFILDGGSGDILITSDMAPYCMRPGCPRADYGDVWLLAYDCPNNVCPHPVEARGPELYSISERPLFQVRVNFSTPRAVLFSRTELEIDEGRSEHYTIRLATRPSDAVTVSLSAVPDGIISFPLGNSFVFDQTNWSIPQTVEVRALDNDRVGNGAAVILHSVSGADYEARGVCAEGCRVSVGIEDNDSFGASVSPTNLVISEDGSGAYAVSLQAMPSGVVTLTVSADPSAGVVSVSDSLTFTPHNWRSPQTVTVRGIADDTFHSPARSATISHAFSGGGYDAVTVSDVSVVVVDRGTPGVTVSRSRMSLDAGESGAYTLSLGSKPVENVVMSLSVTDSDVVSVSPDLLTFTPDDWSAARTARVTGVAAGSALVHHQGRGDVYDGVRITSVQVEVTAASEPGASLSESRLTVVDGGSASYSLRLTGRPDGDVRVDLTSSDSSVAVVSPSFVTFTTGAWHLARTFKVTAVSVGDATVHHHFSGGGYDGLVDVALSVSVVSGDGPEIGLGGVHPSARSGVGVPSTNDVAVDFYGWSGAESDVWDGPRDQGGFRGGWQSVADQFVTGVAYAVSYVESIWPVGSGSPDDPPAGPAAVSGGSWDWLSDTFVINGTGFSTGHRAWVYLVVPDADDVPTSCSTVGVNVVLLDVGTVDGNGAFSFDVPISPDTFREGANYICAVDALGKVLPRPTLLTVYEPPDVYRMELTIDSVQLGERTGRLPDDFSVIDGKHYGEDAWRLPQYRGVSESDYRTRTQGNWRRCRDEAAGPRQVGCDWSDDESYVGVPGKVGLVEVAADAGPVAVPGDFAEFRIGFGPTQFSGREKERFAVYWGPVDLWLLGAPAESDSDGVVMPHAYAIHGDHLAGLGRKFVTQSDLDEDGYYTFKIPRTSANARGDTFVAVVPCNVDYFGVDQVAGSEIQRNKRALPDCSVPVTPGVNFESTGEEEEDGVEDGLGGLRSAWQQHDVQSGRGLFCESVEVEVTRTRAAVPGGYTYLRDYEVKCSNILNSDFSRQDVERCHDILVGSGVAPESGWVDDVAILTYSDLKCGFGPLRPFSDDVEYWGSTDYNAARSIYGFVVDWQRGGELGILDERGCAVDLLRYRLDSDSGQRVSVLEGTEPVGAKYWRIGSAVEERCTADDGVDALDVVFYTPEADSDWSAHRRAWHEQQPVHFALYVTGMPAEHDERSEGGDGDDQWRRVALGSWDVKDPLAGVAGGGRRPVGLALPLGDSGVSLAGDSLVSGVAVPSVSEMTGGTVFTVPREYADANGRVRLYVVPCLPLYGHPPVGPFHGPCHDVARGAGDVDGVANPLVFRQADDDRGPFGLRTSVDDQMLNYSYLVTVTFNTVPGVREVGPVSVPGVKVDSEDDACEVTSRSDGSWGEALIWQGGCDSKTLEPVEVVFDNSGGSYSNLAVYATGGRSDGLDLVAVQRSSSGLGGESDRLGRLGLLERIPVRLPAHGKLGVLVTPDMANRDGEIWLMAYDCHGSAQVALCPRNPRSGEGSVPAYSLRVSPAFVVRVKYTDESGISHTDLGPVCQGDDCDPVMPVLREVEPSNGDECRVNGYSVPGVIDDPTYWPDRLVAGGGCEPGGLEPVEVVFDNAIGVSGQRLVVYATGGRSNGLEAIQVRRAGEPAGRAGLRRVEFTLGERDIGRVLVSPDMADAAGQVLLLVYRCSSGLGDCPAATAGADLVTYAVDRRPLFQVLVQYDDELLSPSGFAICRGDSCSEIYELERFDRPSGLGCSVSASYSEGEIYWPDRVVAGGACDRRDLDDVTVTFSAPSSSSGERLVVYVTGGRSPGLEPVSVLRAEPSTTGGAFGRRDVFIPFPENVDVDGASARASASVVAGVLDGKDWVQDGVQDGVERRVYDGMQQLAEFYNDAARVANMSFLDTVDDTDYLTVMALLWAADRKTADTVVNHFSGDIDDDDRFLVIGSSLYSDGGVASVAGRLDAGGYDVKRSEFFTDESPSLVVWVARNKESDKVVPNAAQLVSASVESMEEMMGRPFPVSHVVMFLDSGMFAGKYSDSLGVNYGGIAFSINHEHPDLGHPAGTIIHEVSHYFWKGARIWINEGMAETALAVFGGDLGVPLDQLETPRGRCRFDNLKELDDYLSPSFDGEICPYYLGQQFFLDLRDTLGVADFRAGVRRLYDTILAKEAQGVKWGDRANVDDLREAFSGNAVAQEVIDRHWFPAISGSVVSDFPSLGRLGLRQETLTIPADGAATVSVSPDLAREDGHVWLLAYRCDSSYGDAGCPSVQRPVTNGYDLPKGPDFAVRVKFTEESGLTHSTLGPICQGDNCVPLVPVLREAAPANDVGVGVCGVASYFGSGGRVYWPDRVILGGACDRNDLGDVPVSIRNVSTDGGHQLVVYATGGRSDGLDLVRVRRGGASVDAVGEPSGRMGLRRVGLRVGPGGLETVPIGPDLADQEGNVWLLAYLCDAGACPEALAVGDRETYAVARRPLFQLRVRFTPESGLRASSLSEVCQGQNCDVPHPWLRMSEPTGAPCSVGLGTHWPDRVISGGSCWFRGTRYGAVSFENLTSAEERFVVYTTGDAGGGFGALPVYGVLRSDGGAVDESGVQLGRLGLKEHRLTASAGGSAQVYFRSEMAGDAGDVWVFVYRCSASHGDAGCPLVGRDVVRPAYDIGVRPTFVVRAGFLNSADVDRSNLDIDCLAGEICELTAVFRDADGNTLPGTAEFRVDAGVLGAVEPTASVSQVGHDDSETGFRFVETLRLPAAGGIVNVTVELLGDGLVLRGRAGQAASLDSLSVRLMRCSGDEASCHSESVDEAANFSRGDWFVVSVLGRDAAGGVGLEAGVQSEGRCTAGIVGDWPVVRLSTAGLRAHPYGTGQLPDRGYAGCAFRVTDDADFGAHGYTVRYTSGGQTLTASGQVVVVRGVGGLSYLDLRGPSRLESGETGVYRVVGYTLAGLPLNLEGGCLEVDVSGELSADDDCIADGISLSGATFEVTANEGVLLDTDSSVGVSYDGRSVRRHVLVVPAEDDAAPVPPSGDSHITDLVVALEGDQLRMSWVGSPTAAFASMRAQMWVEVGGVAVFLPGCEGGEVHETSTYEVFCLLSYGQSEDVYHGAVGYFRWDGSAVSVETVEWTRP